MNNTIHNNMRKLVLALMMLLTLSLNAQNDGVIKFLGIPVDGTKSEMISKLKQKGFTYDKDTDMFIGEFNGENIKGIIQTYKNKVYNIRFSYDSYGYSKSIIIQKFNSMVYEYDVNDKYLSKAKFEQRNNYIDENEDIEFEMGNGKSYEAKYYYVCDKDLSDTTGFHQFKIETCREYESLFSSIGKSKESVLDDSILEGLFVVSELDKDVVVLRIINGMFDNTYLIVFDYLNRRNAPNGEDL